MNPTYLESIYRSMNQKMLQYSFSALGGLFAAFESTIDFFIPCMIAIALDIYTAVQLGKRVKLKYPEKSEGKIRSSHWTRVGKKMILIFLILILAAYVDTLVLGGGYQAKSSSFGFFLFYQSVSIGENWSSENDNKFAQVLQKVLVNKAQRHFDVDLSDIFKVKSTDKNKSNENQ